MRTLEPCSKGAEEYSLDGRMRGGGEVLRDWRRPVRRADATRGACPRDAAVSVALVDEDAASIEERRCVF